MIHCSISVSLQKWYGELLMPNSATLPRNSKLDASPRPSWRIRWRHAAPHRDAASAETIVPGGARRPRWCRSSGWTVQWKKPSARSSFERCVFSWTNATPSATDGSANGTGLNASLSSEAVASMTSRVFAGLPPAAFFRTAPMGCTVDTAGEASAKGPPTAPIATSRANSAHAPWWASRMG